MAPRRKDLTGNRYGRLVALEPLPKYHWLFQCDCGVTCSKRSANVLNGTTSSCGCARKGHATIKKRPYSKLKFFERLSWDKKSIARWGRELNITPAQVMARLREDKEL